MKTITAARIKEARNRAGFSARELSELIGVKEASIWHWEGGRYFPKRENLSAIAKVTGVSAAYLRGEEEGPDKEVREKKGIYIVNRGDRLPFTRADIKEILSAIQDLGDRLIHKANSNVIKFPSRPSLAGLLDLPVGAGKVSIDQIQEHDITVHIPVEAPEQVDFLITVRGDSMSPLIQDGALLFVRKVPPESLQAVPCMSRRPPGCGRICLACEPGAP